MIFQFSNTSASISFTFGPDTFINRTFNFQTQTSTGPNNNALCQSFPGLMGQSNACFNYNSTNVNNQMTVCGSISLQMGAASSSNKNLGCITF